MNLNIFDQKTFYILTYISTKKNRFHPWLLMLLAKLCMYYTIVLNDVDYTITIF